jgi:hypothetical protein
MFVLTTLVYPVVLALICVGAGLLVDRASGDVLPAMLLPAVGAAALIVGSQLTTYSAPIAPATPYALVAIAAAGFALGRERVGRLARAWRACSWQLLVAPLAYVLALAPVLLAGRPTFSSYMALADSAVHMLGADFLIRHGQDYSHLDVRNSYGATMDAYYNASYPSGADTLLGGSARLLRVQVMWAFQPFAAFMLATACGPAWVLARRMGLERAWAALAALTITLPALVYAYELIGSVKEIVALPLILCMGALVVTHRRWLWRGPRAAIPFALLLAAGVAALGVAFGAWALAATLVLAAVASAELSRGGGTGAGPAIGEGAPEGGRGEGGRARTPRETPARGEPSAWRLGGLLATGLLVLLIGAWPTWANVSNSVKVAQAIASTSNPGNLHSPLHPTQLLGVWLGGSYKLLPTGFALTLTSVLVALAFILALVGVGYVVRSGWYALAGWFATSILLWLVLNRYATTWADAKALMLTSPVVVLMAWAGIAALRSSRLRFTAPLLAFVLVGGVFVSDALQYHESNLAPTARYEELASLNTRFAGRGPTLFTDFDEYALYELRDLDVGGPDFASPPPALAGVAGGHGQPVALDRAAPRALAAYPLIVTRRDPSAARPPAAYRLLWRGTYYEVWGRRVGAKPALAHVSVSAPPAPPRSQCSRIGHLATVARSPDAGVAAVAHLRGARLVAALSPRLVAVPLPRSRLHRPPGWTRARQGILMRHPGTLRLAFRIPHGGVWQVWLKADVMRALRVAIDGRPLGSLGAQLDGNSLVANVLAPLRARLSAGPHILTITRPAAGLAPGDGGAAVLRAVFLTPATTAGQARLRALPAARWRSLCGRQLQWVELLPTR